MTRVNTTLLPAAIRQEYATETEVWRSSFVKTVLEYSSSDEE